MSELSKVGLLEYKFLVQPWQYLGKGSWFFVSLPQDMSCEIRDKLKFEETGWGRLKAIAQIGESEWATSIWFDTKLKCYLLPLKAEIRKLENIGTDQFIETTVWL